MTDTMKTTILNTVTTLFFSDRIHDTCTPDGIQHDCMGCPFRSHYIDNPTDDEMDGVFYEGICEREGLSSGCTKWMHDMGEDL